MAKYKKKSPAPQITNSVSFDCPAISVIIPMYNVEKYVGECLDSLLAQTFTDFEAIVVDDCSTDKSVKIAESYAPKFGGRLKILHMQKNSGGAGFPRNKGVETARGKYVYFLDPDDTITPTALEELFSLAKDFDADVVACEKFYKIPDENWNDAKFGKELTPVIGRGNELVTEPVLLTDDVIERMNLFHEGRFIFSAVLKIVRRKFIIDNEIKFADCFAEDALFTMCSLYTAKRYVLAPNIFYYYREREGSAVTQPKNVPQLLHRQIKALKTGFKYIDKFFSDRKAFERHPDLKYILFDSFAEEMLRYLKIIYDHVSAPKLDKFLRKEFSDGDNLALNVFIFNMMNVYRLQLIESHRQLDKFNRLSEQIQQRLDELEEINRKDKAYISELEKFIANEIR